MEAVEKHFSYPLTIDFSYVVNPDGSANQTTTADQKYLVRQADFFDGKRVYESNLRNEVSATDALNFDASGTFLGPTGGKTTQRYSFRDSRGHCYQRTLTATAQKLTSIKNGRECED